MNLTSLFKNYIQALLFPQETCLLCEKPVHDAHSSLMMTHLFNHEKLEDRYLEHLYRLPYLCETCKAQLEIPRSPYCFHCHKPLLRIESVGHSKLVCGDCLDHQGENQINRSAVLYNDFMKEKMALYKYRGKESLAKIFSYFLKIAYDLYFDKIQIDLVTCVPLHPNRLKERGFNQSQQLAEKLSDFTGIPAHDILDRILDTSKQSKRRKKERLQQLKGSIQLKANQKPYVKDKNVLIIDDIYTTGATIQECKEILKLSGAKEVYSLTLCRAYDQKNDDKQILFI